jgi:hypothetical protein
VRADLPVGVQAAQIIHAAGYSSSGDLPEGTYAVALTTRDESELRSLALTLAREGHRANLIIEQDEPYTGQAMALGIAPCDRRALRPILRKLPLMK